MLHLAYSSAPQLLHASFVSISNQNAFPVVENIEQRPPLLYPHASLFGLAAVFLSSFLILP